MPRTGKIPSRLVYVASTVHRNTTGEGRYNTFVTNFDSYQETTAVNWAGANPLIEERDNTPVNNVRLLKTTGRGENRHIFRVLIDGKFEVDLTEEALLDACNTHQGVSDGLIRVPMIWAIVNGKLKLIAYQGKIYQEVEAFQASAQLKPIKPALLKKGFIYEDKYGTKSVFLGVANKEIIYSFTEHVPYGKFGFDTEKTSKFIKETCHCSESYEDIIQRTKLYYENCLNKSINANAKLFYMEKLNIINNIT